ncbi:MAG: FAD:protein FMN transferase [bacterium]
MPRGAAPRFIPLALFFLCIAVSAAILLRPRVAAFDETRVAMDTYVTVRVVADSDSLARAAVAAAFAEIDRVAAILDWFDSTQVVGRAFAPTAPTGVRVAPEIAGALGSALDSARRSGGRFDPTIRPVMRLWAFDASPRIPHPDSIRAALARVGYSRVSLDAETIAIAGDSVWLDLGGVAKGFATESATRVLREITGVRGALVAASGDIRAFGRGPHDGRWDVGLAHPRIPDEIAARFALREGAVSTSGDYERCFFVDGVRYHHIIDATTGYPSERSVSATVFAPTGTQADALATASFLLGPAEGAAMLASVGGCEGLWITSDGGGALRVTMTPGLEKRVRVNGGFPVAYSGGGAARGSAQ